MLNEIIVALKSVRTTFEKASIFLQYFQVKNLGGRGDYKKIASPFKLKLKLLKGKEGRKKSQ